MTPKSPTAEHNKIDGDATQLCPLWKVLCLVGALITGSGMWLFVQVQAAAVERAVVKDRLERMADDVKDIKDLLRHAVDGEKKR